MVEKGYQYYIDKIIKFNSDKDIIALREQYNRPSFFEIISKQRSETTYSAFLKWLFQIKNEVVSPIMGLLDILVQHSFDKEETQELINPDLRTAILSRKLKISNIQVETEKSVGQLAQAAKDSPANDSDKKLLKNIALYCQDRIDIYIECDIEIKDDKKKKLQIIIENKIDSAEGGPHNKPKVKQNNIDDEVINYFNKKQTTRYYDGTNRKDIYQIYAYLTPQRGECDNKHFVLINYQDILDGIILPLLSLGSLSARDRFFLEEFKNELMFPNVEYIKEQSCIAISQETSKTITTIWKQHKELIISSILATTPISKGKTNFWIIDNTYYDSLPKKELLKKQVELPTDSIDLLKAFYEENSNFIYAFINAIKEEERNKVKCFFYHMTKRKKIKYIIYYNGELKGENAMGNWDTVFQIIKLWASEQSKILTLEDLQKAFPVEEVNECYYRDPKFNNIIYKYDSGNNYEYDDKDYEMTDQGKQWHFYTDDKHHYKVNDKTDITLVKMWREGDVEKFIDYVQKKKWSGELKIIRSD